MLSPFHDKGMKILVVGGSGHVSGAVARAAVVNGHAVWTVTRGRRCLPDGVRPIIADRHDHEAMESAVTREDRIWDLVVDCICFDERDIRQDIELFRQRARQFVFVSSDFVYDPAHRRVPQPEETEFWENTLDYGRKKRCCEEALINGDTGGMNWTIIRPCHVYGPSSQLGCLPLHGRDPRLIEKMRAGEVVQLVGGGRFLQQPILADDLAGTIISAAGNSEACRRVFNVAGPDVIESWQYYQIIADVLGVELKVKEISAGAYRNEHPEHAPFLCHRVYDLSRAKAAGLYVPSTPLGDGLRLHVAGLLTDKKVKQGIPVLKGD